MTGKTIMTHRSQEMELRDLEVGESQFPSAYGDDASDQHNLLQRTNEKKAEYARVYSKEYARRFGEASYRARNANPPLFIPNLTGMRQRCLEHLSSELRTLESRMKPKRIQDPEDVARAMDLMRDFDVIIESEARRLKLEDPEYSGLRGLNVVHLEMEQLGEGPKKSGTWVMLSKDFERSGRDVIEPCEFLSEYQKDRIRDRFAGLNYKAWTNRSKSTIERRPWTLKYESNGQITRSYKWTRGWLVILIVAVVSLICFYGVGIIATNSTFSPTFQRYFFWIAIFWSLISSSLLSWIIALFGGHKRDVVAALLSGVSIWLVVIQIGQTRLLQQKS